MIAGALVLGVVIGVGSAFNTGGGAACSALSSEAAARLESALPGYAPAGASLGDSPVVVRSDEERAPFFAHVYFVAALVDARPALWVMNRPDGSGVMASVNEYAYEVTGLGRTSTWSQPITESDANAQKALSCLLKSLPQP